MERMGDVPAGDPIACPNESRGLGAADLAYAIADGRAPRASSELGCHVLDVCDALLRSAKEHTFVKVESTCERPEPMAELG